MHEIFESLIKDINFTQNIKDDSNKLFLHHKHPKNAEHSLKVALEAQRLAKRFNADEEAAMTCGFLHDIGEIIPSGEMVMAAAELNIDIFEEECQYPIILHQKISREMANQVFEIKNPQILTSCSKKSSTSKLPCSRSENEGGG